MEILRVENLDFTYPDSKTKVIDDISFSVNEGEFIVVMGESGCGKTTLLKCLKKEIAPHGEKSGNIIFSGKNIEEMEQRESAASIGYVLQRPELQIVTDKVYHEMAFGLENLGLSVEEMRLKVGEMVSYFGLDKVYRSDTDTLSGGQKQLLNLASIMVMSPKLLLLDEPTSQLDPIAASEFIATLQKINRELGTTIIIVEHRLEELFSVADKVMVMDSGKLLMNNAPKTVATKLKGHKMFAAAPTAVRIYQSLDVNCECPINVREGRNFLQTHFGGEKIRKSSIGNVRENIIENEKQGEKDVKSELELQICENKANTKKETSIKPGAKLVLQDIWFRYEKHTPDVLRGVNLTINEGEIFAILGGNGSGKTTTLNVALGLLNPYKGKVIINGKPIGKYKSAKLYKNNLSVLPQDPQTLFTEKTVELDLMQAIDISGEAVKKVHKEVEKEVEKTEIATTKLSQVQINKISQQLGIKHLLQKHPYDLSGGEQQKVALAKILLRNPKVILLDEPTKGIDSCAKEELSSIIKELSKSGITVVMVTHDVEFCAITADRCGLFFDGNIMSVTTPTKFFNVNNFYTTAASRMSRDIFDGCVTVNDVVNACVNNLQ